MKKLLLVGAIAAATAAMAQGAHAQSTVTLYGLIETGIDYYNNSGGKSLVEMRDGAYSGLYGSRWGLVGSEDLGGGFKGIFRLENGFNSLTGALGQGGREFGRQAYVGISHDRYGTVTLGRQYDSIVDYLQFAGSGSQWGGIVTHGSDIDNLSNSYRIDNSIKYTSPEFRGFKVGGLYAFSNSNAVGGPGTTAVESAGANYTYGSLKLGAAYFYAKHPATLFTDGHYVANTTGSAIGAAGPWSYVGNPRSVQTLGAGASYRLGSWLFGALYTRARFEDANGTNADVRFDDYDASVSYYLTPATKVGISYLYTLGHVDYLGQKPKYHRIAIGADTQLSKRTELIAIAVVQQAAGDAKGADIYQGTSANMSTTNRQVGLRAAVIHRF
jgi:predicted porin